MATRAAADGRLSVEIPADVQRATLRVAWREFALDFALAPASAIDGAQERLNHLNFPSGPADGVLGPVTAQAIRMFQAAQQLAETGELDAATQAALVLEHGT
jgi:peptidoglycan hydrolase-like protein with peptidoglycan-binding domain